MQYGDYGGDFSVLREDLARDRLHGQREPRLRIHEADLAAPPLALRSEEEVRHEGGEVRVVGLHAHAVLGHRAPAHGEEALRGRVHHDQRPRGVGHQDGTSASAMRRRR